MNKQEYLDNLANALSEFGDDVKNEIVNDYEEHFNAALENGKTEEQVAEELGSIEELVTDLRELTGALKQEEKQANATEEKADEKQNEAGDNNNEKKNGFNLKGEDFTKAVNEFAKDVAGFIGFAAAKLANGAEKVGNNVYDKSGEFTGEVKRGFGNVSEKVVNKSTEFAKEIKNSFSNTRNVAPDDGERTVVETRETFDDDEAKKIIFEGDCADVTLEKAADGKVTINYDNEGTPSQQLTYKFSFEQKGDTIIASVKKQLGSANYFRHMKAPQINVTIAVPDDFEKVTVKNASGDITANDVCIKEISFATMSGDVYINNVVSEKLSINSASGDVDINNAKAGIITAETISGDVSAERLEADKTNFKTVSGDVEINAVKKAEENKPVEINANTVSGDVNIEITNTTGYEAVIGTCSGAVSLDFGDSNMSDLQSGTYSLGDASDKIKAVTVSGDIDIQD